MALKVKDKMEPMNMMSGELWKPCRQKQLKKGEGKRPKLAVVREQRGGRRRGDVDTQVAGVLESIICVILFYK